MGDFEEEEGSLVPLLGWIDRRSGVVDICLILGVEYLGAIEKECNDHLDAELRSDDDRMAACATRQKSALHR